MVNHLLSMEIGSAWFLVIAAGSIAAILISVGMVEELVAIVRGATPAQTGRVLSAAKSAGVATAGSAH